MESQIFKFDLMPQKHDGGYIVQYIEERKLSETYHSHDFYELIALTGGSAIHVVNGKEKIMSKGDAVLLLPEDSHCFISQSEDLKLLGLSVKSEEFMKFVLAFEADIAKISYGRGEGICFSCQKEQKELIRLSESMKKDSDLERLSKCRLILSTLINACICSSGIIKSEIPGFLESAVRKMRLPEYCIKGVPGLLDMTKYSYPHLYRLTEKYYGKTPHELVFDMRMECAYNKILFSDENTEYISEEVGYKSFSHFNSVFKKYYGITPAALRKKNRKMSSI